MVLRIWHDSGCKKRFEVFVESKKRRSGEECPLPQKELRLQFVERNPLMSRLWFLRALALFIAGLLSGNFGDFKDVPRSRTEKEVLLSGVGDDLDITFSDGGCSIFGAETEKELSAAEIPLPQVEKRIRAYKIAIVALGLAALGGVLAWLIIALA